MADERIEIEIVLDDGTIAKGFKKVNDQADDSANKIGRSFTRAFQRGFNTRAIGRGLDVLKAQVFNLRNALIGAVAILGGGALARQAVALASVQQDAINALNTSLRTAGSFSEEASQQFQEFASSLQQVSTVGDEVLLQQLALARNFTRSNEEAQKLTQAALELSAASGISLDSAVKNLGKTFAGLAGEIGESVPAIRALTAEQLKAGAALDLVINRFGGSALAQTRTFSGALTQLQNTVGDLFERFGQVIVQSPSVIALFNSLTSTINSISGGFNQASFESFFKGFVINAASFVNAAIDVFETFGQVPDFIRFVTQQIKLELANSLQSFLLTIQPLSEVADFFLGRSGESAAVIAKNFEAIADIEAELDRIGDASIRGGEKFEFARASVESFITEFQRLSVQTASSGNNIVANIAGTGEKADAEVQKLVDSIGKLQSIGRAQLDAAFAPETLAGRETVFESLAGKSKAALERISTDVAGFVERNRAQIAQFNDAIQNGFGRAASAGIQGFVNALIKGENALQAFGKAFLGVLGDLAIQLGTTILTGGLGLANLFAGNPAGAIAFGASLIAVGTLLKALSGGGFAGAGIGGAPPAQDAVTAPIIGDGDLREPGASVQVVVNGSILDGDETGLRIADILKEQGFNNAVVS